MWFIGSPMAKKKSWFDIVKRFFIRETNSKPAKVKWLASLFSFGNPQFDYQCEHVVKEFSDIRVQGEATQSNHQCEREILEFAATRIQSAFRGYLVSLNKHSLSHISFLNFYLFSANLQMSDTLYVIK